MATVTVDNAKLVLNAFAATLQNNLLAADLVEWRKFDKEMNDRNALTVVEQVVPRYSVTRTVSAVNDLTSGVQDTIFGSEQYTVKNLFNSSLGYADFIKIRDLGDARESEALKAAATQMAEDIDNYIMGELVKVSNNWVGTAGNAINDVDDILTAYTRLKDEGTPDEGMRAIMTYGDKQALGTGVVALPALDGMATDTFRKGFSGSIGGIPTAFTQQLRNITVGTRAASGAAAMNGGSQNVNYADVAISSAPGRYKSQTISINGLTGSQTIKAGEVFTIANVNAWDNRAGQTLGRAQQFVVLEDATASSGAIAALRIYPAIIVQGSSAANTPHATVDAAPGATAAITFIGTASTAYRPRLILAKDACVMSCADLITPYTDTIARKSLTKVPLSVRMWKHSDFATGAHSIRFDVAATLNVRSRNKIIRVNGG